MKITCKIFGHKFGKPTKVYGNFDWIYNAVICGRCGKRNAISAEDQIIKNKMTDYVSIAMNSDRARLGLAPISWED